MHKSASIVVKGTAADEPCPQTKKLMTKPVPKTTPGKNDTRAIAKLIHDVPLSVL